MKSLLLFLLLIINSEGQPPLGTTVANELSNVSNQSSTSLPGEEVSPSQPSETNSTPLPTPSIPNFGFCDYPYHCSKGRLCPSSTCPQGLYCCKSQIGLCCFTSKEESDPFYEVTSTEKPPQHRQRSVKVSSPKPKVSTSAPSYPPTNQPPPQFQLPLSLPIYERPYKVTIPFSFPKPSNHSFTYPLVINLQNINQPHNFYPTKPSYSQVSGNTLLPRLAYRLPSQQPAYERISYRTRSIPRPYHPQYVTRPDQPPTRNPYYPSPLQYRVPYPVKSDIYAVVPDYREPQSLAYNQQRYQRNPRQSYNERSSYRQTSQEMTINPFTGEIMLPEANAPSRYYRSSDYFMDDPIEPEAFYVRRRSPFHPIFEEE